MVWYNMTVGDFTSVMGDRREQLADLDRMLNLLDGKACSGFNRNDLSVRLAMLICVPNSTLPFTKTSMLRYVTWQKGLGTSSLNALI
jgi:hypothetical protein